MPLESASLTQDELGKLLTKGLEKDLIDQTVKYFTGIAQKEIERVIREKVTEVVKGYLAITTSLSKDYTSGEMIININFIPIEMMRNK